MENSSFEWFCFGADFFKVTNAILRQVPYNATCTDFEIKKNDSKLSPCSVKKIKLGKNCQNRCDVTIVKRN